MKASAVARGSPAYPPLVTSRMGDRVPELLHCLGDAGHLHKPLLGMQCSVKCPGLPIVWTFDAARALRDAGVVVTAGFQSPMEAECLKVLLRGKQPVVWCLARALKGAKLGTAARKALSDGRLLVVTPFGEKVRDTLKKQTQLRNEIVAAMAYALWVPYAEPGGNTHKTVMEAIARNQPVYTFVCKDNQHLLDAGARPFEELGIAL